MLINQTDFLAAVPIAKNFDFDQIKPDIRRTDRRIIKAYLGALYDELDTKYNAETPDFNAKQSELLTMLHDVIGNLSFMMFVPKGNLVFDNNGAKIMHSKDEKSANEWQIKDLTKSLLESGYDALEDALAFLEENEDDFPDWDPGKNRSQIVQNATQVQEFINISSSRVMYYAMVPIMNRYISNQVTSAISAELVAELKAQLLDKDVSVPNQKLLHDLRGAIVHYSYGDLVMEKAMISDDQGYHLINNGMSSSRNATTPAEESRLRIRRDHHHSQAGIYLGKLVKYLHANADDYPLYKDSSSYQEEQPSSAHVNTEDSKIITLGI